VTDELDHQVRLVLRRRKRSRLVPITLIVFAIGASAAAYLWLNYVDQIRTAIRGTRRAVGSDTAVGEQPISRSEYDALERRTATSIQTITENLETEKVDMQKLSTQVSDLTAKLDELRNVAATASAPPQNLSPQPIVPPRPAAIASRKQQPRPKPTGPISVGGAPLLPAPNQ
jgi:hypothetical protein